MAKMIGLAAMSVTISGVSAPFMESPKKTSAPFMTSASVRASVVAAWADFHWFMPSSRPW